MDEQGSVCALHQEGALADAVAKVVQLGAADFATAGNFDFRDAWGVHGEYALDAFAVGDFADGKRSVHSGTFTGDHEASENLNAFFASFNNPAVDFYRIADVEILDFWFELFLFDFLNDGAHDLLPKGEMVMWFGGFRRRAGICGAAGLADGRNDCNREITRISSFSECSIHRGNATGAWGDLANPWFCCRGRNKTGQRRFKTGQ